MKFPPDVALRPMRFIIIVVIIRGLIAFLTWFLKVCFQIGFLLGSGLVWLFKRKKPVPQVDPTQDANSVKPLRDE